MTKKRSLGFWMLTALVAGNMIGSGIFLLPASLASFGSISIVAWITTAFGALCLALVFAQLSHLSPKVGGPYAYCHDAFGDFIGFEVAFNYWIAAWVGNAAIAIAFAGYLSVFFPILVHDKFVSFCFTAGIVWVLTFINILGVRQAGIVQLFATILKLVPLLLIGGVGIFYVKPEYLHTFNVSSQSNFAAFTGAAVLTLWSFIGVESATVPAEDVENPKRVIPLATITGAVIAATVYILGVIAIMGVVPMSQLANSSAPYADAAQAIFGSWGKSFIAVGAMISCFGALNGWILLQGQVPYAAAKDGLFPRCFARKSRNGTPVFGLVVSSIFITILLYLTTSDTLVKQFTFIITLATLSTLIPYLFSTMAQIILFYRSRDKFNVWQFARSLMIAVIAFAYSYWAIAGAGSRVVYYGVMLFFTGVPIYAWMRVTHEDKVAVE